MDGTDQIYKGPDGVALRFYYVPAVNNFQTEKHGHQIFDTSLMVEVMVPGMRESTPQIEIERILCTEAGSGDGPDGRIVKRSPKYAEYSAQVEAFKRQTGDGLVEGTPLASWTSIDAGTTATLKAAGVFTVEQLAAVSDGNLGHLGIGGLRLREMAQQFLNTRTLGQPSAEMASQNATMRNRIAELEQQVADLQAALRASAPVAAAPPPPPPVQQPAAVPDVFNIDDTNTLADGVDGLGTPPAAPAFDPNSLGTPAPAPLI